MRVIAQTPRIIIREYVAAEEELFIELFADERLTPYLPKRNNDQNREIFRAMLADYAAGASLGKWGIFGLDGDLIGFVMLKLNAEDASKAELGYNIHYKYWNTGIATEACKILIDYGFNDRELKQITAVIVPENVASEKVLIKAGLHKTASIERDGEILYSYAIDVPGTL